MPKARKVKRNKVLVIVLTEDAAWELMETLEDVSGVSQVHMTNTDYPHGVDYLVSRPKEGE